MNKDFQNLFNVLSTKIEQELINFKNDIGEYNQKSQYKQLQQQQKNEQEQEIGLGKIRTLEQKIEKGKQAYFKGNNLQVAKQYGIDEKSVRNYKAQYLERDLSLNQMKKIKSKKRLIAPKYFDMEVQLFTWIEQIRLQGLPLSQNNIRTKAKELCNNSSFQASPGWFERFTKRWKISSRSSTHIMQKFSFDMKDQIEKYLNDIFNYRLEVSKKQKELIFFNIDESPLVLNFHQKTYDKSGKKEILIKGIKSNRVRYTLVIMINSLNQIFPPLIIGKGSYNKKQTNQFTNYCLAVNNSTAWITEDLYLLYLQSVIGNLNYDPEKYEICLIHDQCSVHKMASIENFLQEKGIRQFLLPPGSTSLIQVLDTSFNKPLKDRIKKEYNNWLSQKYDVENSINQPNFQDIIQRVLNSLNKMNKKSIFNGFKHCGLTVNLDHSENHLINQKIKDVQILENTMSELIKNKEDSQSCAEVKYIIQSYEDGIWSDLPNQFKDKFINNNNFTKEEVLEVINDVSDGDSNQSSDEDIDENDFNELSNGIEESQLIKRPNDIKFESESNELIQKKQYNDLQFPQINSQMSTLMEIEQIRETNQSSVESKTQIFDNIVSESYFIVKDLQYYLNLHYDTIDNQKIKRYKEQQKLDKKDGKKQIDIRQFMNQSVRKNINQNN